MAKAEDRRVRADETAPREAGGLTAEQTRKIADAIDAAARAIDEV